MSKIAHLIIAFMALIFVGVACNPAHAKPATLSPRQECMRESISLNGQTEASARRMKAFVPVTIWDGNDAHPTKIYPFDKGSTIDRLCRAYVFDLKAFTFPMNVQASKNPTATPEQVALEKLQKKFDLLKAAHARLKAYFGLIAVTTLLIFLVGLAFIILWVREKYLREVAEDKLQIAEEGSARDSIEIRDLTRANSEFRKDFERTSAEGARTKEELESTKKEFEKALAEIARLKGAIYKLGKPLLTNMKRIPASNDARGSAAFLPFHIPRQYIAPAHGKTLSPDDRSAYFELRDFQGVLIGRLRFADRVSNWFRWSPRAASSRLKQHLFTHEDLLAERGMRLIPNQARAEHLEIIWSFEEENFGKEITPNGFIEWPTSTSLQELLFCDQIELPFSPAIAAE